MHINELPFDILSLLLKYTVGMQAQSTKNWKHTIQLLGVCRKWRQVASPWVNYWAFIECYESLEDEPYDKDLCLPNSSPNLSIISANSGDLANEPDSSHEIAVTNSPESVGQSQGAIWMSNIEFHHAKTVT
ncbi:hypothetical protein LPJ74_004043 [Coemansia sp. RSA 1843]|nr:hypothetical protein LPJ74_004043 [Coemansia sp. RSA 1843]